MLLLTYKFQLQVYNKSISILFYFSFLSYFFNLFYLLIQLYLTTLNNWIKSLYYSLLLLDHLKISLLLSLNKKLLVVLIRYLYLIYHLIIFYLAISSLLLVINLLILFLIIFLDTSNYLVNISIQTPYTIFTFLFI